MRNERYKHSLLFILMLFVSIINTNILTATADVDKKINNFDIIYGKTQIPIGSNLYTEGSSKVQGYSNIVNGGFEDPDIRVITSHEGRLSYQVDKELVPGWDTTAYEGKIELLRANYDFYIEKTQLTPREGEQSAELNGDEQSTLFQYVDTEPGKTYEWGLSHRGRMGNDMMALIIGPKQSVDPYKESKAGKDQFMKMGAWFRTQNNINIGLALDNSQIGCSRKIIIFSKKFAANGSFVGGDNDAFSWNKDEVHSEEWNAWLMCSGKSKWEDYGSVAAVRNYDYTYDVPENSNESIFAFCSFQTAANNQTLGNFLDVLEFKEYYNAEAYTTPGGTGTFIYQNENKIDYYKNYTGKILKDDSFTIIAHENAGSEKNQFLGARINNEFISADRFINDGNGNYTYVVEAVNQHYTIRLIFAAKHNVIYDINVGNNHVPYDDYHYDGTENTGYEVEMGPTRLMTYTSHETKKYNADGTINDGWLFCGWKYEDINNNVLFDGIHTVKYITDELRQDNMFVVYGKKAGTSEDARVTDIPTENGVTMVAQWKYRQAFIPQVFDAGTNKYINSDTGGDVEILDKTGEPYLDVGKKYFGDENELITAQAFPKENYEFKGWYNENNEIVSSNRLYSYHIENREVKTLYARFDRNAFKLKMTKIVTGNMGDRDKYFTMALRIEKGEAGKTFKIKYENNGVYAKNPTQFTLDNNGVQVVLFYLKHGGSFEIEGLKKGYTYRFAESSYVSEGYTTTGDYSNTMINLLKDEDLTIYNHKNAVVPSGVETDNKSYILMIIITLSSIFLIMFINLIMKKRLYKGKYNG